MSVRTEFRLSGSGGQGILTAGIILAEGAILEGQYALQSQSYGPEARGGASKAEIVISVDPIDYPKATTPNYLLCLTTESFHKYSGDCDENTVIFCDDSVDTGDSTRAVIKLPIISTAVNELRPIVANVVALGFMVAYTKVISEESALSALLARIPKGTEELNKKAFETGLSFAKKL